MDGPPATPADPVKLTTAIAASSGWDPTMISSLIAPGHLNLADPHDFTNEQAMVRLADAAAIVAKTGVDANLLFNWADPTSAFWACRKTAQAVRRAAQSRYTPSRWDTIVKPLNDVLRTNQQAAPQCLLLAQDPTPNGEPNRL